MGPIGEWRLPFSELSDSGEMLGLVPLPPVLGADGCTCCGDSKCCGVWMGSMGLQHGRRTCNPRGYLIALLSFLMDTEISRKSMTA